TTTRSATIAIPPPQSIRRRRTASLAAGERLRREGAAADGLSSRSSRRSSRRGLRSRAAPPLAGGHLGQPVLVQGVERVEQGAGPGPRRLGTAQVALRGGRLGAGLLPED